MTTTNNNTQERAFSAPLLAAMNGPLEPIVRELEAAGFFLYDNGEIFGIEGFGDPPAIWAAQFQDDPGHLGVVVSITSQERAWGISIKASACGLNGGVCYWATNKAGPLKGPLLSSEPSWPGLKAAVAKAESLAMQHREATSSREQG